MWGRGSRGDERREMGICTNDVYSVGDEMEKTIRISMRMGDY